MRCQVVCAHGAGAGLDERLGVGTEEGVGRAEGLLESEERYPEVEARQAEPNEGAGGRRRDRQGIRPRT